MSEKTYKLEIVTPEKRVCALDAVFSVFPGSEGELGILAGHAPVVSRLLPGEIRITPPDGADGIRYAVTGGFLEVSGGEVSVLAETAETPAEIDKTAALAEKADAEKAYAAAANDSDKAVAGLRLQKVLARIKVAETA